MYSGQLYRKNRSLFELFYVVLEISSRKRSKYSIRFSIETIEQIRVSISILANDFYKATSYMPIEELKDAIINERFVIGDVIGSGYSGFVCSGKLNDKLFVNCSLN